MGLLAYLVFPSGVIVVANGSLYSELWIFKSETFNIKLFYIKLTDNQTIQKKGNFITKYHVSDNCPGLPIL